MEFDDLLRSVRLRWLMIATTMLAFLAIAAVVTLSMTPQYRSTARIFISTPQSDNSDAFQGSRFSQQRVKSYADLLTGEAISRRVVDRLKLDENPRQLSKRIDAQVKPDTVVLAISVKDSSPARAQQIAQAVADEFVAFVAQLETPDGKSTASVRATIIDSASFPNATVSPKPSRNLGLAGAFGLLVGLGVAVFRESRDSRIRSSGELDGVLGSKPIIGNIDFDKSAAVTPLISELPPYAPRVEAFRVLRLNLQFASPEADGNVLVVTSAQPMDGKTSIACNLALSLAEAGQRVVLVEADLRRPNAVARFGLDGKVGVTTVLCGRAELDEAIRQVGDGCYVLPSGALPPNPAELLQTEAMEQLIGELRRRFDVVLIDGPPLLPVSDAASLARLSTGALLVVRHGVTTREQVDACAKRLAAVHAPLLGAIVNMTPTHKPGRGGFEYGYGFGYGYPPESKSPTSWLPSFGRQVDR